MCVGPIVDVWQASAADQPVRVVIHDIVHVVRCHPVWLCTYGHVGCAVVAKVWGRLWWWDGVFVAWGVLDVGTKDVMGCLGHGGLDSHWGRCLARAVDVV